MGMICWYRQFKLLVSTIELVISTIGIYQQLELAISLIPIVDVDNWYYCVHVLLISTIGIVDINNVRTMLISTIVDNRIVDIDNSNCRVHWCIINEFVHCISVALKFAIKYLWCVLIDVDVWWVHSERQLVRQVQTRSRGRCAQHSVQQWLNVATRFHLTQHTERAVFSIEVG